MVNLYLMKSILNNPQEFTLKVRTFQVVAIIEEPILIFVVEDGIRGEPDMWVVILVQDF